MQPAKSLTALTLALALSLGTVPAFAQSHSHDAAAEFALVLNNGAKWQGDQNMIDGMSAIRATMAANLDAIHHGTLSPDAAKTVAADVQAKLDFMIENCVLEPEVDEQFHVVLGEVMTGVGALEEGEVETGAHSIVLALNAYGEHFEHPEWQPLE